MAARDAAMTLTEDTPPVAPQALWRWAEPMIYDTLRHVYERALGEGATTTFLAREHGRLWSALIAGRPDLDGLADLEIKLSALDVGIDLIHRGNAAVAAELAEIVEVRTRSSTRARAGYEEALDALRGDLAAAAR